MLRIWSEPPICAARPLDVNLEADSIVLDLKHRHSFGLTHADDYLLCLRVLDDVVECLLRQPVQVLLNILRKAEPLCGSLNGYGDAFARLQARRARPGTRRHPYPGDGPAWAGCGRCLSPGLRPGSGSGR